MISKKRKDIEARLGIIIHIASHHERGGSSITFQTDNVSDKEKEDHFNHLVDTGYVKKIHERVVPHVGTGSSIRAVDCNLTCRGRNLYAEAAKAYGGYLDRFSKELR